MEIKVNVEKKYFLGIIGTLLIIVGIFVAYAIVTPGTAPNPGHISDEIAPPVGCIARQFLSFNGTSWICANNSVVSPANPNEFGASYSYSPGTLASETLIGDEVTWKACFLTSVQHSGGGSGDNYCKIAVLRSGPNTGKWALRAYSSGSGTSQVCYARCIN